MRTPRTLGKTLGWLWGAALALLVAIPFAGAEEPVAPQGAAAPEAAAADGPEAPEEEPSEPPAPEDERELLLPETPAPEPGGHMDEMVVRGRQREDLLEDVPISTTSFNTAELKSLRVRNIADLAEYTPNLEINTAFAASNPTLFIRGIGLKDYNANAAGAVAVYQDGININSPAIQLFQLFDVGSVEVQRGPQGSLNGRNASAGAISVSSILPGDAFEATGSFSYGNYNNLQFEGAMTVPLIDEKLSWRGAFTLNFRDGTTENKCADWDPVAQGFGIDLFAAEGIEPILSQTSTEAAYERLDPHPGVLDPGSPLADPDTGIRPVMVRRTRRGNVQERTTGFVYLDTDWARQLTDDGIATINRGPNPDQAPINHRWELDEALTLEDGTVVPVGTPIGLQNSNFQLNDSAADSVCIVKAPGLVLTDAGAFGVEDAMAGVYDPFPSTQVVTVDDLQGLQHHVNDVDDWAARSIMRYRPFDGMEWILNAHGGQNRSDSRHLQSLGADGEGLSIRFEEALEAGLWSEAQAARLMQGRGGFEGTRKVDGLLPSGSFPGEGGADPFKGSYNRDGTEFLDTWGFSVRGNWDLGGALVTLLSGYEWYDRFVEDEGDANPFFSFPADWQDSAWQVSEELRVEGEGERYIWRSGLFFLYEELDAFNIFPDTRQFRIEQTFAQVLWSVAPYVAGRYFLSEELSIDAGVRYNAEHKDFTLGTFAIGTSPGAGSFEEIPAQNANDTWTGVTGDVTISYAPQWDWLDRIGNHGLTFYTKYARGMKGGHFNAGLTIQGEAGVVPRVEPVEPEFIHAAEVGFRSRWFDDRLLLSVAGFRYWYKDLQVFDIANEVGELPLQKLLNGDAKVWGAEAEIQARPLPGLLIQSGIGLLDSEFVHFKVTKAVNQPRGLGDSAVFNYRHNPLIAAPSLSFSGIAEYQIPLFGWGFLVPQYDFSYRSKLYFDPQHADPISQEPYWLHNARLAYRTPDGRIEVAGWVQNFMNQQYKVDVFDVSRDFNTILEVWGDPRTYGLTVTYAW